MTVLLWGLGIGVGVLTAWVGRRYVDNLRNELHTDAYKEGWSDGYKVAGDFLEKRYDAGWDDGYKSAQQVKKVRKPVKSTKKITGKE